MHRSLVAFLLVAAPAATLAQAPPPPAGRVADSAAGQVGERRLRGEAVAGIEPLSRIDGRVESRIRNRLRTRIDRDYDARMDAASLVEAADDRSRAAGRARRR